MKKLARNFVAAILGHQVRKLCKKNQVKVIAVVGSIGKTSTKLAITEVLKAGFKVRSQEGNYNDLVTVPLVFFGEDLPSLFNPLAWAKTFKRNQRQIKKNYPYQIIVLELGSDGPGQIAEFKKYLNLEIGVTTAITPEHMAFFANLDEVAQEELAVSQFSSLLLINKDLCDQKYFKDLSNCLTYSLKDGADYNLSSLGIDTAGLSVAEQYSRIAAAAVATKLGMDKNQIKDGLKNVKPPSGRMQRLAGVNNSVIIDDSYNSSPDAVKLALNTLYELKAPQKIALLGNMNELGDYAKKAHKEIGEYCDPKKLDLVVTLGPEANQYLAPAAEAAGCVVQKFDSPYEAGEYIKDRIKNGAAILVKGSQNKVFAEEAIKSFLTDPTDTKKLVRQSENWLKIKRKAFKEGQPKEVTA